FDAAFTSHLKTLTEEVQTEEQQTAYNELITRFGTHYVSSVIVGGRIHIYTFIGEEYLKRKGRAITEKVISDEFQARTSGKSRSNDFRTAITYLPPVASMNKWLDTASDSPAVINRTVSSLSNLISSYSKKIRKHLQRTIDYYMKYGVLPILTQINTTRQKRQINNAVRNTLEPIPGLDVVGCGFDITFLESKFCLLNINNSNTSWTDPFNASATFSIPNGYFVMNTPEMLVKHGSKIFSNLTEFYQETYSLTQQDTWGFFGFGATSSTKIVENRYRQRYQYNSSLAWTYKQIIWYTLAVASFPRPKLNPIAKRAFNEVPSTYDSTNVDFWREFFLSYGTHYIVSAEMGGIAWAEDWLQKCFVEKKNEIWAREQVMQYWWFISLSSTTESYNVEISKYSNESLTSRFQLIGGIETTHRRRFVAVDESNAFISRLESMEDSTPPPSTIFKCGPDRKKRTVSPRFDLTDARLALCPMIGYYGSQYCPNDEGHNSSSRVFTRTGRQRSSSLLPLPLPTGIGMAIDVATGKLLLPALELTFSTTITNRTVLWTDSKSGQAFIVPTEAALYSPDGAQTTTDIRIFRNEQELVDVWLRNENPGSWSGGEYSQMNWFKKMST
ncbi:unnamed protein product, partial [Didymodactylos carnosus]